MTSEHTSTDTRPTDPQETATPQKTKKLLHSPAVRTGLFGALGICIVLLGAGYASTNSTPGGFLYSFKLHAVEPVVAFTKFGTTARLSYDATRMERRLTELKMVDRDTATSSPETLAAFADQVHRQASDAVTTITESSLNNQDRIDALAQFVVITKAQETLAEDSEELKQIEQRLEEAREQVDEALEQQIEAFATARSPEEVVGYLTTRLEAVSATLPLLANGSDAQRRALARISTAQEAILDEEWDRAIIAVLNAEEVVRIDQYLFDAERGPVDGAEIAPVPEEG